MYTLQLKKKKSTSYMSFFSISSKKQLRRVCARAIKSYRKKTKQHDADKQYAKLQILTKISECSANWCTVDPFKKN